MGPRLLEVLPVRSSICGWPAPTSLLLEDVVDLLKFLFARGVAQDISSLEEYGSILLEFNRNFVERPSTLSLCHESEHFGTQTFEFIWLLIFLYSRNNSFLQLLPPFLVHLA